MNDPTMTAEQSNAVYDILKAYCGATEGRAGQNRQGFVSNHLAGCREWRFGGVFGFGGKFYLDTFTVDGYQEDMGERHMRLRDMVNGKLADLKRSWESGSRGAASSTH